jgi:prolyl 4-hydroxylase
MFLGRGQDPVIAAIEDRIALHTAIPASHGEGLQVLHYAPGELYEPHFDSFHDQHSTKNGGQRIATMLMYLSDVEEGGETVFPSSADKPGSVVNAAPGSGGAGSPCARAGVAVAPRAGDALLFYSLTPDGRVDPKSLHGGCPVLRGDKWSATKWMRVGKFDSA